MKLLVIGGTGKTGRELIKQGLAKGHFITAVVRNPKKIKFSHKNLNVIEGDVLIPASIEEAFQGQEAVLCALGHKQFIIKTTILSRGTKNIIAGMAKNGVNRLICITSLGINDSRFKLGLYYTLFTIPFILFFYFLDKSKQEKLIMNSTLEWTIVRPGQLTNGKKRTIYKHGSHVGHYILTKMISRADVAHFMLSLLNTRDYMNKTVGITY
ncbi:MAG: SDR family oxidoreductase [Bacteroidia bacterium]|nr:SDR family oxidoreductase [Bacteroidia bacterium]MBT8278746.1 SDR family oxidoreductase [Bacteroidia bacterium]MBT8395131.1 SDR family oxidoreductase [Bacteroidia bacterium]NND26707.1 SDR family oxidoreductase [Flavobacteriaceae bacterium]